MPRIPRIIVVGYPHHIVQRGNNRQIIFFEDKDRFFYLNLIKKYSNECSCSVRTYCLMNNHIHMLVEPNHNDSLAKLMQKLSLCYTQYVNKKYHRTGRLWECRFHSTVVDRDSYFWTVCRYIERNPVRAKISSGPLNYKWSSAKINTKKTTGGLLKPICSSDKERQEYIKFLCMSDNENEIKNINRSVFTGKPFGSKKFIAHIKEKYDITISTRAPGRPRKHITKNGICS